MDASVLTPGREGCELLPDGRVEERWVEVDDGREISSIGGTCGLSSAEGAVVRDGRSRTCCAEVVGRR
jgi:hypothetical protein